MLKLNDPATVATAVDLLRRDMVIAIPTETVYGLAGSAFSKKAIKTIFRIKGRPSHNPLICHVTDMEMAEQIACFDKTARQLAQKFWPGPLTLVLPVRKGCGLADPVTAGLETVAVRCPDNAVVREIIASLGVPLAAPSANVSGRISPTSAEHVLDDLSGKIPLIIDGGTTKAGIESTIVKIQGENINILRAGIIGTESLTCITDNRVLEPVKPSNIEAPGQLSSHYAPLKPLRINADTPQKQEFFIGFGNQNCDVNLSVRADLGEAAKNLYAALRKADKSQKTRIAVAPIPQKGIGLAINDRLKRAAHDSIQHS